ncbi:MAG TPA: CBS domain-containing protein [Xanthobacteraceae bacterium]|nr:CBS domain-containing protein [Xanthobacteraceae bacterium]
MKAKDVMTQKVISVSPDDTILRAIRLMLQNNISGLPVLDTSRRMVGIVTEGDLLRRAETGTELKRPRWIEFLTSLGTLAEKYVHSHGRKVHEVMTPEVCSVTEDTSLADIVELMEKRHIKRVPVVRDGEVVGIVSRANILHAVAKAGIKAAQAPAGDDSEIKRQLVAYLDKQRWAPVGTISVDVKNGVVTFTGVILDDREREALRVAAENTPGVKNVVDQLVWVDPTSGYIGDAPSRTN